MKVKVSQSCPNLCDPTDRSTPDFPVYYHLLELDQTHVHQVGDVIQPSHPLSSPSPPAFSLSQHQGLFQWISSSHQVAKVLELQHQSFQWLFRTDFLSDWLKSLQSCPTLCGPMNCNLLGSCSWDSPGKNTGVGCSISFPEIFLIQGLNLHLFCLLHWQ